LKIRVYYEDTDIGGIVYYANYLKFCERARSHLFFDRGMMPQDENGGFVVKELSANYIASATLGDVLDVGVELVSFKNASLKLRQEILKDSKKIFEAEFTLVYVKEGKPSKIPERLKEVF
jgi:acyl-CoA thioester hydrolase